MPTYLQRRGQRLVNSTWQRSWLRSNAESFTAYYNSAALGDAAVHMYAPLRRASLLVVRLRIRSGELEDTGQARASIAPALNGLCGLLHHGLLAFLEARQLQETRKPVVLVVR